MYTKQTHGYIQTEASTEPLTYGTSHFLLLCYISLPPPIFNSTLSTNQHRFIHFSKGSGLLLIRKMTLVWSLLFILCRDHSILHTLWQGMRLGSSFPFCSVNPLPAFRSSTVASDLVLALNAVKLVVETQLLSFFNSANAADDDFVTPLKCYHLSNTVRGTRMIDISCDPSI